MYPKLLVGEPGKKASLRHRECIQNKTCIILHLTDSVLPLPSQVGGRELEPQLAFVDSSGKWRAGDHRHSDHHHLCEEVIDHYCTHWYMHNMNSTLLYVHM